MKAQYLLACLLLAPLAAQSTLPGTAPLTLQGDLAAQMVDSINDYPVRESATTRAGRSRFWHRDFSSADAYSRSIEPNRQHLARILGAVDPPLDVKALEFVSSTAGPELVGRGRGYRIQAVRWPVWEGVFGEGLLLQPDGAPVARVVALPDADWTPEMLAGLSPGLGAESQFARRLAESGCQVLIPTVIDRHDTWSGIPGIKMTNQPHREWIYRMAFETGRHIIGYEVQKVRAAVGWFEHENAASAVPIVVAGYGEGGLLALYSAALDTRIDAALVSGYFQPREQVWKEPIYRDLWGLLREFGDAEIADMIAPRALVVEASATPQVSGPPQATKERNGATPNGTLSTPPLADVRGEVERARAVYDQLHVTAKLHMVASGAGSGPPGSEKALAAVFAAAGVHAKPASPASAPERLRATDPDERMHRQFDELVSYTQRVIRQSPRRREEFWAKADASSPEKWKSSTKSYRDAIWSEVIGRMPDPSAPANPRTRLIYDQPKFRGYEVMLDVWPGIYAYGILLIPKDIKPGERRPVVVCQHGLEGRPSETAEPGSDSHYYHRFAARLAEEGFVTYAPQNPYIGEDRFRIIQRKGHPLQLSLFSFILGQHQRTLEWLGQQPFVDRDRIGFYGLSYGGKTAVRVPPLLDGYALSICSADFNEWVWKTTSADSSYSYMLTREYDMLEFNFANVVNYSDLANLMAPRPFMVERGHGDGVAPDEWVAYEYAKVRRFYDTKMHMPDRTAIEFFDGPHTIHGEGTFEFLRKHLHWPPPPPELSRD
jgi:dienelactone hydrolase